ncbi:MAG: DivIVA domain-containing protein [Erysipelotrichaceae bacterium]|nr:DivIVA domain-containing protein [Erysipelotrichaceae bacterium]
MSEASTNRFRVLKQGYDRFEVDRTIEQMTLELDDLKSRLDLYMKQSESSSQQLNLIKQRYQTLIGELNIREKAADEIARLALKEANRIIDTAQNNADSIVREALSTARIILVEIARISQDANEVKSELKEKLDALSRSIEDLEIPVVPKMEFLKDKDQDLPL